MFARSSFVLIVLAAIALPVPSVASDYAVLLVGNSHSARGDLPRQLATLLQASEGSAAHVATAPRWAFLSERIGDGVTREALQSESWSHVVLQAQKYSTTGRYHYPTDAAEEWIRRVRAQGAEPVLFPEWARRDHSEEAVRIQKLHMEIALREPACVAPVGLAWELVLEQHPNMPLYERDGNHANHRGALLTAYVLYETIAGQRAADLPDIESLETSAGVQAVLRAAASEAHARLPACGAVTP